MQFNNAFKEFASYLYNFLQDKDQEKFQAFSNEMYGKFNSSQSKPEAESNPTISKKTENLSVPTELISFHIKFINQVTIDAQSLRKTYRQLSLKFHPDNHADASEIDKKYYEKCMAKLNESYDFLADLSIQELAPMVRIVKDHTGLTQNDPRL